MNKDLSLLQNFFGFSHFNPGQTTLDRQLTCRIQPLLILYSLKRLFYSAQKKKQNKTKQKTTLYLLIFIGSRFSRRTNFDR